MIAVVALVLAVLELVFLAGVVLLAVRFWRQARPMLEPYLAMFAPPPETTFREASRDYAERRLGAKLDDVLHVDPSTVDEEPDEPPPTVAACSETRPHGSHAWEAFNPPIPARTFYCPGIYPE